MDLGVQNILPCLVFQDDNLIGWKYFKTVKCKLQTIFCKLFQPFQLTLSLDEYIFKISPFTLL